MSAFVGDGANRWPGVHRLDAARLFRLVVEQAPAGSRWHGVGDEGVPFRDIAEVIGRHLDVPMRSISSEEADAHFGFLGALVSLDNPTSNALDAGAPGVGAGGAGPAGRPGRRPLLRLSHAQSSGWVLCRPSRTLSAGRRSPPRGPVRPGVGKGRHEDRDCRNGSDGLGVRQPPRQGRARGVGHRHLAGAHRCHRRLRPDRLGGQRQLRRRQPPRRALPAATPGPATSG